VEVSDFQQSGTDDGHHRRQYEVAQHTLARDIGRHAAQQPRIGRERLRGSIDEYERGHDDACVE
jgi:hypothetical protein